LSYFNVPNYIFENEKITGIKMLKNSFRHSQLIRKRYTVLDLTLEMGMWQDCVDVLLGEPGFWGRNMSKASKITAINTKADKKTAYQKA
jgi:hypothetical protein